MLFFLLACGTSSDSGPEPVTNTACHDGDQVLIESGYEAQGYSFSWTLDEQFIENGGSFEDEDAPDIVATCPPCTVHGVTKYTTALSITDEQGVTVWQYGLLEQLCGVR